MTTDDPSSSPLVMDTVDTTQREDDALRQMVEKAKPVEEQYHNGVSATGLPETTTGALQREGEARALVGQFGTDPHKNIDISWMKETDLAAPTLMQTQDGTKLAEIKGDTDAAKALTVDKEGKLVFKEGASEQHQQKALMTFAQMAVGTDDSVLDMPDFRRSELYKHAMKQGGNTNIGAINYLLDVSRGISRLPRTLQDSTGAEMYQKKASEMQLGKPVTLTAEELAYGTQQDVAGNYSEVVGRSLRTPEQRFAAAEKMAKGQMTASTMIAMGRALSVDHKAEAAKRAEEAAARQDELSDVATMYVAGEKKVVAGQALIRSAEDQWGDAELRALEQRRAAGLPSMDKKRAAAEASNQENPARKEIFDFLVKNRGVPTDKDLQEKKEAYDAALRRATQDGLRNEARNQAVKPQTEALAVAQQQHDAYLAKKAEYTKDHPAALVDAQRTLTALPTGTFETAEMTSVHADSETDVEKLTKTQAALKEQETQLQASLNEATEGPNKLDEMVAEFSKQNAVRPPTPASTSAVNDLMTAMTKAGVRFDPATGIPTTASIQSVKGKYNQQAAAIPADLATNKKNQAQVGIIKARAELIAPKKAEASTPEEHVAEEFSLAQEEKQIAADLAKLGDTDPTKKAALEQQLKKTQEQRAKHAKEGGVTDALTETTRRRALIDKRREDFTAAALKGDTAGMEKNAAVFDPKTKTTPIKVPESLRKFELTPEGTKRKDELAKTTTPKTSEEEAWEDYQKVQKWAGVGSDVIGAVDKVKGFVEGFKDKAEKHQFKDRSQEASAALEKMRTRLKDNKVKRGDIFDTKTKKDATAQASALAERAKKDRKGRIEAMGGQTIGEKSVKHQKEQAEVAKINSEANLNDERAEKTEEGIRKGHRKWWKEV
ncbi:MAG: hypothetical protein HQM16_03755 [Deltaproteobacteria bacterium]|nr:hypothetical protein [Deltaproteobacteria bacterium]